MRIGLVLGSTAVVVLGVVVALTLGLHRRPRFIHNFEQPPEGGNPFLEPASVSDGLAVYSLGSGEPVLLFPYPHAHTSAPMAQEPLAQLLAESGFRVVSFDVPGTYRSTRKPTGDMAEMLGCADETLARLGIAGPVRVVGHSMSGLCALAYAVERPERVKSLVLVGSVSGFPAAARYGMPGSYLKPWQPDFWRIVVWGMRVGSGRADLALHKRLANLMGEACFYDRRFFTPLEIRSEDRERGVPIRMIWTRNMYRRLSYAQRLSEVTAPTLVCVGRFDREAPLSCSYELATGIPDARLVVFESSGHLPFVEESGEFTATIVTFFASTATEP